MKFALKLEKMTRRYDAARFIANYLS
jgi:hypothetical protein